MLRYDPSARYDVDHEDLEYRRVGGQPLLATVYRPRGDGPFPALLEVHGGAWNGGARDNGTNVKDALAATGIVVVAIDFRLAPEHPYPAQVSDVNYATRWLKAHATELGADVSCLGGIGSSSGGHTLMLSATRPEDRRYADEAVPGGETLDASFDYVVLCWSVLDSWARYEYARAASERLMLSTEAYFSSEAAMREGSPTLVIERGEAVRLPPALLLQGTADDNIPIHIPERFVAAYRAAGGAVDYHVFEGMPHRFMFDPGEATERGIELTKAFIASRVASQASTASRT